MDWADRIGRRIRLRDLHILLAVAEWGSMAKASAHLAISHPVVSKTISDLEHTVGVRLFDRNSQGVELTTYGRALLKCGVTVFDEMRQGLKQIEFLADPESGELAIGCSDITMASLLPAIVECQSALNWAPLSASKRDPFERRVLAVALAPSELAGVAATARARAGT